MWMMGCSSGVSESFSRKVRPHIPRPSNIISPPPYLSLLHSIHGGDHLVHHLVSAEQSKRDFDEPALVSSRWNPTPEQLQTLEELYQRGTRTPSADQIQHITAQLRRYGKIEGKNVFYWFQNHKARERQKRRRRSENNTTEDQQLESPHTQNSDNKEPGSSRTSYEAEQEAKNNNWDFSSITPTPTEEESVSMHNAETSEGIQFDHQVQQNTRFMNRYPTWQMMPSSSTSSTSSSSTRPIFTLMAEDLNLFIRTQKHQESHTLELFPLQKCDKNGENMDGKGKSVCNEEMNSNGSAPRQFFEFL